MIPGLNTLVDAVLRAIDFIHPSAYNLIWFYHVKHANEAGRPKKPLNERDSYERADAYNEVGIAVLFMIKLNQLFNGASRWNLPQSHLFTYELLQSLLVTAMQSESDSLKVMAADSAVKVAFLIQDQKLN